MTRRHLAALATTAWLAGCVSILGVDPEEHEDVTDVVCACSNARARCEAVVDVVLRRKPQLEDRVVSCAAESAGCAALDACLADGRVCSDLGGPCTDAGPDSALQLRCCTGECVDGECVDSCAAVGASCSPAGCCNGFACDGGTCPGCGSAEDPCADSADCCDAADPLTCADGTCKQCVDDALNECDPEFPCCDGGTCIASRCVFE